MKKFLSLLLFTIIFSTHSCFASNEEFTNAGLNNFIKKETYNNQFKDVNPNDWFYDSVIKAYEYGLIKGVDECTFNPEGNITVAEILVMVCRLHSIYNGTEIPMYESSNWFNPYITYAKERYILTPYHEFLIEKYTESYNDMANRILFAYIISNTLPNYEYTNINEIEIDSIPDVTLTESAELYDAVYDLYKSGIFSGVDSNGSFKPLNNIKRCEAAAIMVRLAKPEERILFSLSERKGIRNNVGMISSYLELVFQYSSKEGEYYIFDIDKDGWEELIIESGVSNAEKRIHIYSYDNKNKTTKYLGNVYGGPVRLMYYGYAEGLMIIYQHMDCEIVNKILIRDGSLQENELINRVVNEYSSFDEYDELYGRDISDTDIFWDIYEME